MIIIIILTGFFILGITILIISKIIENYMIDPKIADAFLNFGAIFTVVAFILLFWFGLFYIRIIGVANYYNNKYDLNYSCDDWYYNEKQIKAELK